MSILIVLEGVEGLLGTMARVDLGTFLRVGQDGRRERARKGGDNGYHKF